MLPLAFSLVLAAAAQEPAADPGVAERLRALLEEPERHERRKGVKTLAPELSFEEWVAVLEDWRPVGSATPGRRVEVALLEEEEEGQVVETDLHLYVPESYDGESETGAPLMLMFHGTGGSGRGLTNFWRAAADELGMLVCAPSETGDNGGYAFSARERGAALAALDWMKRRFHVDPDRVFASGISRGGHLAWDLALRDPGLFAAIAPMIGSPRIDLRRGQANLRYVENVVHLSIRDLQGVHDDPGLVFNLRYAFRELEKLGARDAELIEFEDLGHSFDFEAVDWVEFLEGARRDPRRERVVRAYAREGEGRAFWAEVTLADEKAVAEAFTPKISASRHAKMDEEDMRKFLITEAAKRTARLEVERVNAGRYTAKLRGVKRFRLLLPPEWIPEDGKLSVRAGSRNKKLSAKPDRALLLEDFVTRIDRAQLVGAEVVVKP